MRAMTALMFTGLGLGVLAGCSRVETPLNAAQIERQYGLTGAFADTLATPAGQLDGTLVPITLANGQAAHLFIPLQQSKDVETIYLRDGQGLHPVRLEGNAKREEMTGAPAVATRPAREVAKPRSWEREVLIVAGSAGAGAAIGGLAAGKKGAGVGAAAGGAGGLIYDLLTRRKK